jgi:lysozyme family protein
MEASFSFTGHLHNGDPLTAKTVQDPPGRPRQWNPPTDWLSSAIDALTGEGYANQGDWSLARSLFRFERYNGFGYHAKNIPSPYLWSFSNHYTKGKFVGDHRYDPEAVSKQCGAATMLRALVDRNEVRF